MMILNPNNCDFHASVRTYVTEHASFAGFAGVASRISASRSNNFLASSAGDKSAFSAIIRYGGLIKSAFTVRRGDICGCRSLDFRILAESARN